MSQPKNFPGYPHFLDAAALAQGLDAACVRVGRAQPAVNQMATLVSQLVPGQSIHPDTMRVLQELRGGLAIAAQAADAMIAFAAPVPEPTKPANGTNPNGGRKLTPGETR